MTVHLQRRVAVLVVAIAFGFTASALAQTQVRVTRDNAIIWGRDARIPLTTVKNGTVLDVVGHEGAWYVVVVPRENGGKGELGLIADTQVEATTAAPGARPQPPNAPAPGRAASGAPRPPARRPQPRRAVEVFGFGQVGYTAFAASDTFDAVFGTIGMPTFGGGAHLNFLDRWFVEGSIDWMAKTGQRVGVAGSQVYPLGISDRARLVPVAINAGYRHRGRSATSYVGGGVGVLYYRETSDFADPSENVDERFTSYQGVVGVEVASSRGNVRTALEVQFSSVPNALGASGASAAFNEHNLGGVQVRLKIMAGR